VAKKKAGTKRAPAMIEYVDVVVPIPKPVVRWFQRLAKATGRTLESQVSYTLAVLLHELRGQIDAEKKKKPAAKGKR